MKIGRILKPTTFLLLALVLALYFSGIKLVIVATSSMEPWAPRGSLAVCIPRQPEVGEVALFKMEVGGREVLVMHRVVGEESGSLVTKGDANPSPDPWRVPRSRVVGTCVAAIPYAGYAYIVGAAALLMVSTTALTYCAVRDCVEALEKKFGKG